MLAKLKLDNNVVLDVAWANPNQRKVGDKTEDGFTVYEVDDKEYEAYVANHTKLIDGHLVVDADYVPPVIDTTIESSKQDQINSQLLKSFATQQLTNATLVKQIAGLQKGGN